MFKLAKIVPSKRVVIVCHLFYCQKRKKRKEKHISQGATVKKEKRGRKAYISMCQKQKPKPD